MIRKLLLTLSGLTLLAAFTTAPAYARPAPSASPLAASATQRTSIPEICAQAGTGYCLNDWGGLVKMETSGTGNDNFSMIPLGSDCNHGFVTNGTGGNPGPACPFPAGSGLNSAYNNDQIVEIESGVSHGCIGTDFSENANLGNCPPAKNGAGSNIWVIGPECGSDSTYLINVYWSGQHGNADASSLISGGAIGVQAYVAGNNPATSCWGL
jgi:hypothetical protein